MKPSSAGVGHILKEIITKGYLPELVGQEIILEQAYFQSLEKIREVQN